MKAGTLGGYPVIGVKDYLNDIETNMITGETKPIGLGQSDVLIFTLEGDGTCAIRPSGTEPKIKLYVMARGESVEDADAKVEKIIEKSLALLSV